jgi:succinate-acetate transporter protein
MYEFHNENFYSVTEFSSCKNFWDEQAALLTYVNYEVTEQNLS